jgi:predicted DNA-binding transcriptional regulator AlpA
VTTNKEKPVTAAAAPEAVPARLPDERPVDKSRARAILSDPPMPSATFNRGVNDGWLPQPIYVGPRMPRWWPSELLAAINARRMLPREAKEKRRQARLARTAGRAAQPREEQPTQ